MQRFTALKVATGRAGWLVLTVAWLGSLGQAQEQSTPAGADKPAAAALTVFDLLSREPVRDELKISPEQKGRIEELAKENAAAKLGGVLKASQSERLEQLLLHATGVAALLQDDVALSLTLNADQRAQLKKIQNELQKSPQADRDAALLAVLSAEQKQNWEEKLGPPPSGQKGAGGTSTESVVSSASNDAPAVHSPSGRDSGSRDSGGRSSGGPSRNDVVADFGSLPVSKKSDTAKSGSTINAVAVAVASAPGAAPQAEAGPDQAAAPSAKPAAEKRMSFNFRFAPWDLVLKRFAEEAGLTLDMNDVPPGSFNYFDGGTYTPTESLDILNGYLLRKNFALVRRDRFLVVVNLKDPMPPNLIPLVSLSELPKRGRNELLSIMIPLTKLDPKTAADEVKQLQGPHGKAVPLLKVNQLFVTDIGANLVRIHELLTGEGAFEEKKSTNFRSFKLVNVSAYDAERMLRDLFNLTARGSSTRTGAAASAAVPQASNGWGGRGGRGGPGGGFGGWGGGDRGGTNAWGGGDRGGNGGWGGDTRGQDMPQQAPPQQQQPAAPVTKLQLTPDTRTNSLLAMGTADEILMVEEALKSIDVPESATGRTGVSRGENVPQLEVYALESADPMVVVNVLNSTVPGLTIHEDTKTRRLNIYAIPADHETVRNIIKQIDAGAGDSVTVVQLRKLEAAAVAASMRAVFSTNNQQSAPSIEADSLGRRLMIRGTPDQIAQIKKLVGELEGTGPGNGVLADSGSRQPYRTVSPGNRSADEIVSLVQRVLSKDEQVFIRVVPSSAISSPSFRLRSPDEKRGTDDARDKGASSFLRKSATGAAVREVIPEKSVESPVTQPPVVQPPVIQPRVNGPLVKPSRLQQDRDGSRASRTSKKVAGPGLLASQSKEIPGETETSPDEAQEVATESAPEPRADVASPAAETPAAETPAVDGKQGNAAEVKVSTYGGNIVLYSDDMDALDRVERFIQTIAHSGPAKTKWTVYYLRVADATETATMLGQLFPSGTTTTRTSFFASSRDILNESGLGSPTQAAMALRILPEVRSNSLFISGGEEQVNQVLEALSVLDATELPGTLKDRVPRMIAVEYASVTEVAAIVRDVYKEQLEAPQQQQQQQGNQGSRFGGAGGFNPMEMFGGSRFGGAQQQQQGRPRAVQMSIGIDSRTNTLVVSANDQLFRQVESLVESIDESAREANRTVRVVSLKNANSMLVQQALGPLLGKVRVSTTGGTADKSGPASQAQPPTQPQQPNTAPPASQDDVRGFFEQRMMERMMQGGGGGGDRGGFGRDGGGNGDSSDGGGRFGGRRGRFGGG